MTSYTPSYKYRPKVIETAFVDFMSERLYPLGSLLTPKVRLVSRQWVNGSLVALELQPNRRWLHQLMQRTLPEQRHTPISSMMPWLPKTSWGQRSRLWQAGQHLTVGIKLSGICHYRNYSLVGVPGVSSIEDILPKTPSDRSYFGQRAASQPPPNSRSLNLSDVQPSFNLIIAVKPQGLISNYLAYDAAIGEVFDCGLPEGDFTLAHHQVTAQQPLGFIASGSGITPMLGLIETALREGDDHREVTLLYYYRPEQHSLTSHDTASIQSTSAPAFLAYWQSLAQRYPNFRYHFVNTNDPSSYLAGSRHIDATVLKAADLSPQYNKLFVCGTQNMMQSIRQVVQDWAAMSDLTSPHSLCGNLALEHFGQMPSPTLTSDYPNTDGQETVERKAPNGNKDAQEQSVVVTLRRRQRRLTLNRATQSILLGAEDEHIRLPHGCRQGICNMCRCTKISGVVKNLKTGQLSSDGVESIKPCVSLPMSDVVLDA